MPRWVEVPTLASLKMRDYEAKPGTNTGERRQVDFSAAKLETRIVNGIKQTGEVASIDLQ